MNTLISRFLTAALGVSVFGASMYAADQPYVGLAKQLAGHYEGVAGPNNNLRVIVQPARPSIDEH